MNNNESGTISYANGIVSYQQDSFSWSISISDVHLIGEYTNSDGPFWDDYFFVFLTAKENGWHQASFYANGRDEVLAALSKDLGTPIETGLCNSVEWRTRILWPPTLKGKNFMKTIPKKTWLGRLLAKMSSIQNIDLTDDVKSIFPKKP